MKKSIFYLFFLLFSFNSFSAEVNIKITITERESKRRFQDDINLSECKAEQYIVFKYTYSGLQEGDMKVYIGDECGTGQKTNWKDECKEVISEEEPRSGAEFTLSAYTIVSGPKDEGCQERSRTSQKIYVLIYEEDKASDSDIKGLGFYEIFYDTKPPSPLQNIKAEPGEGNVRVSWSLKDTDDDIARFYVLCAPGATDECDKTLAPFQPGDDPPKLDDYGCNKDGFPKGTRSGIVPDLKDGVNYYFAVFSEDASGNKSKVSDVVCARPEGILDFYEVYRQAGGKARGGYCSLGSSEVWIDIWIFLALLILIKKRIRK
jgi:hypothetical protein